MPRYLGVATDEIVQLKIGASAASTTITAMGRTTMNLTPASVAAATTAGQAFALPGAIVGDFVAVTPPLTNPGVTVVSARVSSPDVITIAFINATAGPLVPSAGLYQILLIR